MYDGGGVMSGMILDDIYVCMIIKSERQEMRKPPNTHKKKEGISYDMLCSSVIVWNMPVSTCFDIVNYINITVYVYDNLY
jgi:hypothetical protein